MTGLLGGGHAIYFDAARAARSRNLDCFVAVPGLGADRVRRRARAISRCRSVRSSSTTPSGPRRAACPDSQRGSSRSGASTGGCPGSALVEPALASRATGVDFPPAHAACLAMLAPVMTMNEGAASTAPGGSALQAG